MQNVEDAMEKGEVGELEGQLLSSPTSPTLCGSATGITKKNTEATDISENSKRRLALSVCSKTSH
jgi:hypothetical protein